MPFPAEYNLYENDRVLREAVAREGAAWADDRLSAFGRRLGSAEVIEWGVLANQNPPVLHSDNTVVFNPAWHQLMALGVAEGLHTGPWSELRPGAHVARGAAVVMLSQIEAGVQCPLTMTYGAVPALGAQPNVAEQWLPYLLSRRYDGSFQPISRKTGALMGMGMTEKQGGSDVRATITRAVPDGDAYRITGHKWFMSAPMCDAFLVLAQAPGGLSCFLLPRWTPDGVVNAIRLNRLKDKLGNRSNASSEPEFDGAFAWRIGDEGRGIPVIIEMAMYTRLDCALGSSALMRQAVTQAVCHARERMVFGKRLVDQPLMTNVLADLALESEAATTLSLRLARAFEGDEIALRRLVTPAAKYWICKRATAVTGEAMEVLGGNGYTEDTMMPRLYREAPVNSIWEGSGNIMCLDVLRALHRSPESAEALRAELAHAMGGDRRLDAYVARLDEMLGAADEAQARRLAEMIVLALQGALLVRFAPPAVADAFCASRLSNERGGAFGALPRDVDARAIVARQGFERT
jgi:putative acyl-CoA dehydrogenase